MGGTLADVVTGGKLDILEVPGTLEVGTVLVKFWMFARPDTPGKLELFWGIPEGKVASITDGGILPEIFLYGDEFAAVSTGGLNSPLPCTERECRLLGSEGS